MEFEDLELVILVALVYRTTESTFASTPSRDEYLSPLHVGKLDACGLVVRLREEWEIDDDR